MRIVYLDHAAKLSGGEIALVRLIEALAASTHNIESHVILGEAGPLISKLEATGATVEVLPLDDELSTVSRDRVGRLRNLPIAASVVPYIGSLRRRLRQLHPEIVHTNSLKSGIYGTIAARTVGLPVVWHVRDRLAADYMPRHVACGVRAALRLLPTVVVANSETTLATTGLSHQRDERAFVLYNPYRATAPPRNPGGAERGEARVRIGMVGRISPWKGQHVFIEAVLILLNEGQDVEARLIGDSMFGEEEYREEIRSRVARDGAESHIRFLGFKEDVEAELAEMDIFVHASTVAEPFGQVVVEAMAAGLPVIASNAGGPAELIEDGRNGLLVPANDPKALAQALARLIREGDLRSEIGTRARRAVNKLAPELVAERMLTIYDHAIARTGRPKTVLNEPA